MVGAALTSMRLFRSRNLRHYSADNSCLLLTASRKMLRTSAEIRAAGWLDCGVPHPVGRPLQIGLCTCDVVTDFSHLSPIVTGWESELRDMGWISTLLLVSLFLFAPVKLLYYIMVKLDRNAEKPVTIGELTHTKP